MWFKLCLAHPYRQCQSIAWVLCSSLFLTITMAPSLVSRIYSESMEPILHLSWAPWVYSDASWWASCLLPCYVLSQLECLIPSDTRTQSLHAAPCPATWEPHWCFSTWCSVWLSWYIGHHFLVAASRCPPALSCISPKLLWLLKNWHWPTHSASGHPCTYLHKLDHPAAQNPVSNIIC